MCEQELTDVSRALTSNVKRQRLVSLEKLQNLLQKEETIQYLCRKHDSSKAISWNHILIQLHNLVLMEVDKADLANKALVDKQLTMMMNVILDVCQKSVCEDVTLLNSDTVISIVLSVFEKDFRVKCIGSLYTEILTKYILGHRKFFGDIKLEHWIEMKNLCMEGFKNPPPRISPITYLDALYEIIRLSCKNSLISSHFLDVFHFISNIFCSYTTGSMCSFETSILRLVNILCLQLATEFRYKVCSFMEEIFHLVIRLYGEKENSQKFLIFDFLITYLNVHNPNGSSQFDEVFYACDHIKWKHQIMNIFYLTQEATKEVVRNKAGISPGLLELEEGLLNLVVEINYLVFHNGFANLDELNSIDTDAYTEQTGMSNKRKTSHMLHSSQALSYSSNLCSMRHKKIKVENYCTYLPDSKSSEIFIWLKFLETLLQKYPNILRSESKHYIDYLSKLLHDWRDKDITMRICRCLRIILTNERFYTSEETEDDKRCLGDIWNRIGVEIVRLLKDSSRNQAQFMLEHHLLIRTLMTSSKFRDPLSIIQLYSTGDFDGSYENFLTIFTLYQSFSLPEVIPILGTEDSRHRGKFRLYLLHWMFQDWVTYSPAELSKILVTLVLTRSEEGNEIPLPKNSEPLVVKKSVSDFCKITASNYELVLLRNLKFKEVSNWNESSARPKVDWKMIEVLYECLEQRFTELEKGLESVDVLFDEKLNSVRNSLLHCELLSNLYTHFMNMDVDVNERRLTDLKTLLYLATKAFHALLNVKFLSLSPLTDIYSSGYCPIIRKIIRERDATYLGLLKYFFEMLRGELQRSKTGVKTRKSEDAMKMDMDSSGLNPAFSTLITDTRSVLHVNKLTEREREVVQAVEVVINFIVTRDPTDKNTYQKTLENKLFEELMEDEILKFNCNFHIQLVFMILYSYSRAKEIESGVLQNILKLMLSLYNSKKYDIEMVTVILQIMKEFISSVRSARNADNESVFMTLINDIRGLIVSEKKCGVGMVLKFVEFAKDMVTVDWDGRSIFHRSRGEIYRFCADIIQLMKHPVYEVRLFAAQRVGSVFTPCKGNRIDAEMDWQRKMMNLVKNTLRDSPSDMESDLAVSRYYKVMRTSSSVIAWASIICMSAYWRKLSLFHLIQLTHLANVDRNKLITIINTLCKELNIKDSKNFVLSQLPYIISKWIETGYELEEFPYRITSYPTLQAFLDAMSGILVPVFLWSSRTDAAAKIGNKLNKSVKQLVERSYPELMAIVLPCLNENASVETVYQAKRLKHFLDQELGISSTELLPKHLDTVIFRLFYYMDDRNYFKSLNNGEEILFEGGNSVAFTLPQIKETLENMSKNEGRTVLEDVAVERPSVIQKVLLLLAGEVEGACMPDDKLIAFYKYIAFVDVLTWTIREKTYQSVVGFVIRDVVHTLSAFVRSNDIGQIDGMAMKCLRILLNRYVDEFENVLGEFLPVITMMCKTLAIRGSAEALDVLKFLICDNFEKFRQVIASLDSFPKDDAFDEINRKLDGNEFQTPCLTLDMEHFLNLANKKRATVEGLTRLREGLTNRKDELRRMCDDLNKLKGFSEDCSNSLLHRLMCSLIELTRDENPTVRAEAAKCLGELGPIDLTTLVLKPENHYAKERRCEWPLLRLLKMCVNDLSDLLISENFEMKKHASNILHIILSTQYRADVFKDGDVKSIEYLVPFQSKPVNETLTLTNDSSYLRDHVSQLDLWSPVIHEEWITTLTVEILKSFDDNVGLIEATMNMARINSQFAERIFPILLDLILSFGDATRIDIISRNVGAFFEEYFDSRKRTGLPLNLKSVHCMVNVVDYIRIQRNYEGIYDKSDLNINHLYVAEAARYCSAFFTSILYAELWFNEKKKTEPNLTIDEMCELHPDEGNALTEILRDCYSKIGIFDGVHGFGYMYLLNLSTESQHYEHHKKWNLSMLCNDIELSYGAHRSEDPERRLMHSLEQSGLLYTLHNMAQSSERRDELSDIRYKCASVLSNWDLFNDSYSSEMSPHLDSYERSRYFALKAFHDDDQSSFNREIQAARQHTLSKLSACSLESVQNLYPFLSELRCLKEMEDFAEAMDSPHAAMEVERLHWRWRQQDDIKCSDFRLIENIFTQRIVIVKEALSRSDDPAVKEYLQGMTSESYYKIIKMARKEKRYETAKRNLTQFARTEGMSESIIGKVKIEKCILEWEFGDVNAGKFLLCHYLKRRDIKGSLEAKALRIYGDWMASTNSENSRRIIDEYYQRSIERSTESQDRVNSYASLAKFADSNYQKMKEYLSSSLMERKRNIINRQQAIVSNLRQEIEHDEDREKRIACRVVEQQSVIDENELRNNLNEEEHFLKLAVRYYLLALKEGDKYDLFVFRLISLWFSNREKESVVSLLEELLHQIPSYKFLYLLPQIIPRMTEVGLVSTLVERTLKDHPHHTLPILFALANSFEDEKYASVGRSTSGQQRAIAAHTILDMFRKDRRLAKAIAEMDRFCDAMIELANQSPVADKKLAKSGTVYELMPALKVTRLRNLHSVPVPSLTVPHRKSCEYDDGTVTGIRGFENTCELVGGIHLPKKIKCIGTDGIVRPLLVKGCDDLRQDAVMQQVFTIMNSLLHQSQDTKRDKLVMRTYKVMPLSQRSGIIEWCENTQPLSLYLIGRDGKSGAHKRYYPEDITATECRSRLRMAAGQSNEMKLQVFREICERFHPVFRHFFFETFAEPGVWFERRLAYIHSVATSSMIGHILGIGDRHVHNILVDNATAEVIHIDLGIAFDQGKTLRTPETVPFRLTRDIVDGMGISGVEGVFKQSCIKTMKVLRENQHTILTLLEVLLYYPVHSWTITERSRLRDHSPAGTDSSTENESSEVEINKMAERALIRLKEKLQGMETGGVATNVDGQVNSLIQEARDINNLSRLFDGWQPYL